MNALVKTLGQEWRDVRTDIVDGKRMFMAHDICKILGISNVSLAIKSSKGVCNVSPEERTMVQVDEWNRFRTVHVLTMKGVLQLILNNKSIGCRQIKDSIASVILTKITKCS
jgi:prophage antirepressor-like protein